MATNGRGSAVVGYNVQAAVDTSHHLIIAHDVTKFGNDCGQLAAISGKAKSALGIEHLHVVADRGYFDSGEILTYDRAGIAVTLPKPLTSGPRQRAGPANRTFVMWPKMTSTSAPPAIRAQAIAA